MAEKSTTTALAIPKDLEINIPTTKLTATQRKEYDRYSEKTISEMQTTLNKIANIMNEMNRSEVNQKVIEELLKKYKKYLTIFDDADTLNNELEDNVKEHAETLFSHFDKLIQLELEVQKVENDIKNCITETTEFRNNKIKQFTTKVQNVSDKFKNEEGFFFDNTFKLEWIEKSNICLNSLYYTDSRYNKSGIASKIPDKYTEYLNEYSGIPYYRIDTNLDNPFCGNFVFKIVNKRLVNTEISELSATLTEIGSFIKKSLLFDDSKLNQAFTMLHQLQHQLNTRLTEVQKESRSVKNN